jgi:hypothetical protein
MSAQQVPQRGPVPRLLVTELLRSRYHATYTSIHLRREKNKQPNFCWSRGPARFCFTISLHRAVAWHTVILATYRLYAVLTKRQHQPPSAPQLLSSSVSSILPFAAIAILAIDRDATPDPCSASSTFRRRFPPGVVPPNPVDLEQIGIPSVGFLAAVQHYYCQPHQARARPTSATIEQHLLSSPAAHQLRGFDDGTSLSQSRLLHRTGYLWHAIRAAPHVSASTTRPTHHRIRVLPQPSICASHLYDRPSETP